MEDRYLYKAKKVDDREWVQGYLIYSFTGVPIIVTEYDHILMLVTRYEVDPKTICQCTGLKDKNGKLIWENDIVAYWDTYSTESGLAEADCIGKVFWDNETMSFEVTNRLSAESYEVLDECSVIGNIFDNKELLESEETENDRE